MDYPDCHRYVYQASPPRNHGDSALAASPLKSGSRDRDARPSEPGPADPFWVVGAWPRPKSLRRALQWDGILPAKMPAYQQGSFTEMTPADIQELQTYIEQHREHSTPFDIVIEGETPGDDPVAAANQLQPLAQAGVTWWIEAVWATPETEGGVEGMNKRIQQGPRRVQII